MGTPSPGASTIERVIGAFPLLYPVGRDVVAGVAVAYQPFNVTFNHIVNCC